MASHTATPLTWTDLDQRAVDTARVLAVDAVQNVGHGHPGTARSLTPAAHALFQKAMRHDLADAQWIGRDRFVLSPGHTSLTLSTQLFLSGYGLKLDDLKAFRSAGSKTPGHPEYGHTTGVETTTGPLGQGIATAVGMAMATRYGRGLYDPEAPGGASVFDHTIWAIVPDGDLEEGVFAEASSPASPQRLGNLVALWDDNHISIEVDTATAFSEDVLKRYEAYGWHVQRTDQAPNGDLDVHVLYAALGAAQAETGRPSLIAARTVIAWPAPTAQNTHQSHGAALGAEEAAATKRVLGLRPELDSEVGTEEFAAPRTANPERAAVFSRITIDEHSSFLPEDNPLPSAGPYGRTVHFGIREHAMGAAMNGIALHGNSRTYGGRDGDRLARDPAAQRRPARTRPHPAERADLPGRRRCGQGRIRDA